MRKCLGELIIVPYVCHMAFLRAEKKKSGTYLRIVASKKQAGKVSQQTLYSLGKVEDYTAAQLEAIAAKLLKHAGKSIDELLANSLKELARYNYGYPLLCRHLWRKFSLDRFFKKKLAGRKIKFDISDTLLLLLCERMSDPVSKLSTYRRQQDYIGIGEVGLQHCYRSLDFLADISVDLQDHLYHQQRDLFNITLDVVFYDVTTLYFDAQYPQGEDTLRQKGYSKDGKAHKLQVVLALLVDKQRNPVGYQLYPGNTYEGDTFKDGIKTLKERYQIDKVVIVADRGMLSEKNIDYILAAGYDYIIGERLKQLPTALQETLIDSSDHIPLAVTDTDEAFTYRTATHKGRKVVCTYSAKRAKKDAYERTKLVEKAQKLIDTPGLITQKQKKGAQKYISSASVQGADSSYQLDEQRIQRDRKYDGFLAISTSDDQLPVDQLLSQYNNLFEVEHAFRTLKSVIEIRPMFHWTDNRIRGHVALCFLAYTFINYLTKGLKISEPELQRILDKMQLSKVCNGEQEPFYLRAAIDQTTADMINKLTLVVPKDTSSQSVVNQMFT
ncbi:MAG: IS1634 family transposase [Cyclobacteriaceae bacterium]